MLWFASMIGLAFPSVFWWAVIATYPEVPFHFGGFVVSALIGLVIALLMATLGLSFDSIGKDSQEHGGRA